MIHFNSLQDSLRLASAVCAKSMRTFSTTSFFCSFCWRASKRFRLLQRPQLSEVGRDSVKTKQRNHKDPVFGECL